MGSRGESHTRILTRAVTAVSVDNFIAGNLKLINYIITTTLINLHLIKLFLFLLLLLMNTKLLPMGLVAFTHASSPRTVVISTARRPSGRC